MTDPASTASSIDEEPRTRIERRPLTPDEAVLVMSQIREVTTITGYSRAEWTRLREVHVATDPDGRLVGAALVHALRADLYEVAVLFVVDTDRGRGLGGLLLDAVVAAGRPAGTRLVIFFSGPQMRHVVSASGFDVATEATALTALRGADRRHLRWVYPVQWLSRPYRVRELLRKRITRGVRFRFDIGALEVRSTPPHP